MEVSELNDQQLNESIAKLLGEYKKPPKNSDVEFYGNKKGFSSFCDGVLHDCHPDYIDDWERLMPLVLDNHIQLFVHSKDHYTIDTEQVWESVKGKTNADDEHFAFHKDDCQRKLAEAVYLALRA